MIALSVNKRNVFNKVYMPDKEKIFTWTSIVLTFIFFILPGFLQNYSQLVRQVISTFGAGMFFSLMYVAADYYKEKEKSVLGIVMVVITTLVILFESGFSFFRKEYILYRIFALFAGFIFVLIFKKIFDILFNFYINAIVNNDKRLNKYCAELVNSIKNKYIEYFDRYYDDFNNWGDIFSRAAKDSIISRKGWKIFFGRDYNFSFYTRKVFINTSYEDALSLPGFHILLISHSIAEEELLSHLDKEDKRKKSEKIFEVIKKQNLQSVTGYVLKKYLSKEDISK